MRRIAVIVAGTALVFAACGGSDNGDATPAATQAATETPTEAATETPTETASATPAAGASTLKIEADPSGALAFTEKALTATAGKVTIEFSNPSQVPHAVEIEGADGSETETVTGADAAPVTVDLKAGEYTFYCPVDGHEAAGMVGKLTVR